MKNILIGIVLFFAMAANTYACEIRGTGLPAAAIAELKVACEQAKLNNIQAKGSNTVSSVAANMPSAEQLSEIGNVSKEIAKAIGIAAKELGVAVNDFLTTPAGILIAFGVFWKVFLVESVGLLLLFLLITGCMWMYRKCLIDGYEIKERSVLWGLYKYQKHVPVYGTISRISSPEGTMIFFTTVFLVIGSWVLLGVMVI